MLLIMFCSDHDVDIKSDGFDDSASDVYNMHIKWGVHELCTDIFTLAKY